MLAEHLDYVSDARRLGLYRAAIARVLRCGDSVADLGCGTGVLGLLCLEAGASHVTFIDETAMLDVARETLERAGLSSQATFIRERAQRAKLARRVDLTICDHVGYFGFDYGIVPLLADARHRFLKPDGRLIPRRLRLSIGAVESGAAHKRCGGWLLPPVPESYRWLNDIAVNAKLDVELKADQILGPPVILGELDLGGDEPGLVAWTAGLRAARDGELHGIAGWFDCELADGVWMTNSPLDDAAIERPQAFLPIGEPIALRAGDVINVTVRARPSDDLIAWSVELPAQGRRFDQSTWLGQVLTQEQLRRADPSRVPVVRREAHARAIVLGFCDGRRTAREVAEAVLSEHPELLSSASEITDFVTQVMSRDTEP